MQRREGMGDGYELRGVDGAAVAEVKISSFTGFGYQKSNL